MRVLIFSAGNGSRLNMGVPKALLRMGDDEGVSLISLQVSAFTKRFGTSALVVTGCQGESVEAELASISNSRVTSCHNPCWASGILSTAWVSGMALGYTDSVLRMDGDLVPLNEAAVETILDICGVAESRGEAVMFITQGRGDTVPVVDVNDKGHVTEIRLVDGYRGQSAWACMEFYPSRIFQNIAKQIRNTDGHYCEYLNQCIRNGLVFNTRFIDGIREIDTPADYEEAQRALHS